MTEKLLFLFAIFIVSFIGGFGGEMSAIWLLKRSARKNGKERIS